MNVKLKLNSIFIPTWFAKKVHVYIFAEVTYFDYFNFPFSPIQISRDLQFDMCQSLMKDMCKHKEKYRIVYSNEHGQILAHNSDFHMSYVISYDISFIEVWYMR